ncbi:MAG: formamidopyrimidine-DNA glycosylase, partial [Planctomycetaceae bacterium]|nr:formamidopyrimidine-DNA glycosylase [Planctomycetaceae bacterium]
MPELPEVETMVRGIRPYIEGRRLAEVRRCPCRCRPIDVAPRLRTIVARTTGLTIVSVHRIAKRVVLTLESGDAFVIEPRMTGLMLISNPPTRSHLRFEWRLDEQGVRPGITRKRRSGNRDGDQKVVAEVGSLWFWDRRGLGTLRLYSAEQLQVALGPDHLGPDALTMSME